MMFRAPLKSRSLRKSHAPQENVLLLPSWALILPHWPHVLLVNSSVVSITHTPGKLLALFLRLVRKRKWLHVHIALVV